MKFSNNKRLILINVITAVFYIAVFRLVYRNYLAVFHASGSYRVENNSMMGVTVTNILAFLPILLYKAEEKLSDFISIFLYVMVYVPTMIGLQYYYKDYSFTLPYQLAFLFAIILFFRAGRYPYSLRAFGPSKNSIKLKYFIWFVVLDLLLVIVLFHGNMRLVSFADVYDLRADSMDIKVNIPFIGYFFMWLNSICALMIAIGCYLKKKPIVYLGFAIALVYYMVNGMKSILFIAFVSYGIYHLVKHKGLKYVFPILVIPLVISYSLMAMADNESINLGISIMMNRTYGISAQITPVYIDVFQTYPHTYFSHVNVINAITGMYPFGNMSLGHAVSDLHSGSEAQANTNFLVTDGIASAGIPGVLFISIVFFCLLCYLNKSTNRYDFCFVVASSIGAIMGMSNLSIFTTLLSSGLLFLILFYRLVSSNELIKNAKH